ncbi:MAG: minor capsid protein [Oscillospiraceae bacterium]|nr:minor capsid protein [Oscillospiraceae bacterium]
MFVFRLNKPVNQIIRDSGVNNNSALFAASQARWLMREYIPMDTGSLANSAKISARDNIGVVTYTMPYASFCYYGEKKNFRRDKNEKATAYWDRAMILSGRASLVKNVGDFIKTPGNGR